MKWDDSLLTMKFMAWLVTDGTVVDRRIKNEKSSGVRFQFKLSKQRKIDKPLSLIHDLGLPHTFRKASLSKHNKLQPYMIVIENLQICRPFWDSLHSKKEFPPELQFKSEKEILCVLEELLNTDAHRYSDCVYITQKNENNLNVVKSCCDKLKIEWHDVSPTKSGFSDNYNKAMRFKLYGRIHETTK